ncbi:MAG: BON domain-containing protein [Xanthomonadales bacterium]|jgi:hyperosmotically inducible protein|nr:BON domain-containing protein [Xanthomonadales bacterium]
MLRKTLTAFTTLTLLLLAGAVLAQEKTAGDRVDDTWLHTKVKANLATNQGASINIEVYKGEVQLAGFTTDPALAKSIPDNAARVEGVKKVYNQIIVVEPGRTAGELLDDGVLTTRVNGALADADLGKAVDVNVESNRGTVLLSGFADNEEQRQEAVEIARNVSGVKKVINGINLKFDG